MNTMVDTSRVIDTGSGGSMGSTASASPEVRRARLALATQWWTVALRGLLAIVFGVVALAWPGTALGVLALLFGAYALADGILTGVTVFRAGVVQEPRAA